uniref:Uncharacterized protein n=1 Tax=Romanomermis culicivorax TaxID=13658 RepID=A0A915HLV4_ROMCU
MVKRSFIDSLISTTVVEEKKKLEQLQCLGWFPEGDMMALNNAELCCLFVNSGKPLKNCWTFGIRPKTLAKLSYNMFGPKLYKARKI